MKVSLVHNFYQQAGGEDLVFYQEKKLLLGKGQSVTSFSFYNESIKTVNLIKLGANTIWNREIRTSFYAVLKKDRPDIVHFHNTFPIVSPSGYEAAYDLGIPVVQTLHNYRMLCLNALFMNRDLVCQDCLHSKIPLKGVLRRCYRASTSASLVVASMLTIHKVRRTWQSRVNRYITLSDFARQTFINGGLPAEKVVVKPNFIDPDPGIGFGNGGYALFVGRLSPEKGIRVLLEAWEKLHNHIPLKIAGDGPEAGAVTASLSRLPSIEWLGRCSNNQVIELMKQARVVVIPSLCFENFPITLGEAFATGTPVIASDIGSLHSLVDHGRTGLLFPPGDAEALAAMVEQAFQPGPAWQDMRQAARDEYLSKYTAERNYEQLMEIYRQALSA